MSKKDRIIKEIEAATECIRVSATVLLAVGIMLYHVEVFTWRTGVVSGIMIGLILLICVAVISRRRLLKALEDEP